MTQRTISILGDQRDSDPMHERIRAHLLAAARPLDLVVNTRWMTPADAGLYPGMVSESHGVLLAPAEITRDARARESLLAAVDLACGADRALLATGTPGFLLPLAVAREGLGEMHGELARSALRGNHPIRHDDDLEDRLGVTIDDPAILGEAPVRSVEAGRAMLALDPDRAPRLEEAGLAIGGRDDENRPVVFRLSRARWAVGAAYLPQASETMPHPLFTAFLAAAASSAA